MRQLRPIILMGLLLFSVLSLFMTFPIVSASGEVPWKDQGPEWYYDNLDASDRQKIRQAIDYCVPREQIINGWLYIGYAVAIPSPIGVNFKGVYEPSIAAREYNTNKAKELLIEVFGYEYNPSVEGTNETSKVTNVPYFNLTIIAISYAPSLRPDAPLISYSLNNIGIDTIIKWWNWDMIMPRVFLDPVGTGYDYKHGGYDCVVLVHDTTPDPTYKEYYDKTTFPPSNNCYWIEDGPATSGIWATTGPGTNGSYPNITALWTDVYKEPDPNIRTELLKEYQQWCYDNVPTVIIRQKMQIFAMDDNLQGFDTFHGIQTMVGNWTGIGDTCVIAQPGDYVDFNPSLSNSYYDAIIFENTHVRLARRRGEYNLTHAYPWLAESWSSSNGGLTWTVELRQNNQWSDGTFITADDVVYSYHTILNASTGSTGRGTLQKIIGNATGTDGTYSAVKKGANDYQVIFTLPAVYAYVETVLFQLDILQKAQMEAITGGPSAWKTHGTNNGSIPLASGGQYVMHNYDGTDTVELWVNPYYNETAMGHNTTAVGGGNWLPDPRTSGHILNASFEVIKTSTTAVAGLDAGLYDVIDSQMGIQADAANINTTAINGTILLSYEWGYQEMGLNHYSPIWGMNPHDPRDMYPLEPFNLFSEVGLLVSNPIVLLGLFGTILSFGGFIALLVERFKNGSYR